MYDKLHNLQHFYENVHTNKTSNCSGIIREGGAKNNPVRYLTSDHIIIFQKNQYHEKIVSILFIKILTKTHKIALYFMFIHRSHALKRVATHIILFYTKCSLKTKFRTKFV